MDEHKELMSQVRTASREMETQGASATNPHPEDEETRTNGEKTMTEASDQNTATIHEVAEKDNKKQTKT